MKRWKSRHAVIGVLAAALAVGVAGVALATPPVNFVGTVLARGNVLATPGHEGMQSLTFDTSRPMEIIAQSITVQPGGTAGWHSHPGPTFVIVKSGSVRFYALEASCTAKVFNAGEAWIDVPNVPHTVTNEGSVPAELIALTVFPRGASPRTDVPAPWRSAMYGCAAGSLANQ